MRRKVEVRAASIICYQIKVCKCDLGLGDERGFFVPSTRGTENTTETRRSVEILTKELPLLKT